MTAVDLKDWPSICSWNYVKSEGSNGQDVAGDSFMCISSIKGPSIDPWGTPQVIIALFGVKGVDRRTFITRLFYQSVKPDKKYAD